MNSIEVSVHAHMGFRPWLAIITGPDVKFGLARQFVNADEKDYSRSGRTGNKTWYIDAVGLYQLGGTKRDDALFMVWEKDRKLVRTGVDMPRAKAIARLLAAGQSFDAARLATKPATA